MNPQVNKCLKCKLSIKGRGLPVCGLDKTPCERIYHCPVERLKESQRKHSMEVLSPKGK